MSFFCPPPRRLGLFAALSLAPAIARADDSDGEFVQVSRADYQTTAEGGSDGTVGFTLPAGAVSWSVEARVWFEGRRFEWADGPYDAEPGEFVSWYVIVPTEAAASADQFSYLSDLCVRMLAFDADGNPLGRFSPGFARVAFDPIEDPLVLLPAEAANLAPGDAWADVAPRVHLVDPAEDDLPERYTGPTRADDVAEGGEE